MWSSRPHGGPGFARSRAVGPGAAATAVVGTWDGRGLHVWGWDGVAPMPLQWLYHGFRGGPWPGSPLAHGHLASLALPLDAGPPVRVPTARLDAGRAPQWLAAIRTDPPPGDPLAWLTVVARAALAAVDAGRVSPVIVRGGAGRAARWQPVTEPHLDAVLAGLADSMPPICALGPRAAAELVDTTHTIDTVDTVETVTGMFAAFVDGIARDRLAASGWRPPRGSGRGAAARAVFGALARADAAVAPQRSDHELDRIAAALDRHRRRCAGEPVVVPRLRLDVPDDPGDDWEVVLEVVDEADPGRWCRAEDVWEANPLAVEVAGGDRHLSVLAEVVAGAAAAVAAVDVLAELAGQHEPTAVVLDTDAAADFLDQAPAELERIGVDLMGPERLVRADLALRGQARPTPPDDRARGLGREAVVEWTVHALHPDGERSALTDAELARAEAAGATLLHTGRRWVRIDPAAVRRARQRVETHRRDHAVVDGITLLRLAAGDDDATVIDAPAGGSGIGGSGDGWAGDLLGGLPDEQLREVDEPERFVGTLRPYQRRGLAWLQFLGRLGLGGCLADDMGLGKTATTLAHLLDRPGPHLVVCPLSVVHNWEAEAARFAPKLRVLIHHGAERAGRPRAGLTPLAGLDDVPAGDGDLVVTTYGLLARDVAHLGSVDWSTVVLDEAQMVKNPATNAARAVRQLRAGQKIALTGTPVENRLAELWAILDAVNPGLLGSRERFRIRFGRPIERDGDAAAAARLRQLTQPFVLRRTKADRQLVPDLPDKIEQVAFATLTREQAVLYQHVVDQLLESAAVETGMRRRGLVLAALTRLKQICNHPAHVLGDGSRLAGRSGKLARFDELVDGLLDVGERALVFTQFREMGELLQRHVRERLDLRVPFLHGGVSRARRREMVAAFQRGAHQQSAGAGSPLLLVSLKAGGTGLNLTAASQVIHYDRWWNPAVEDQATDRAWRIGQGRTVVVHKLVCQGTVEERIATIIDEKRALADAVVGRGDAWLSELSTAELRDLVALDAPGRP